MEYRLFHSELIKRTGGQVIEDRFVKKFGVCINSVTKCETPDSILELFNIDKGYTDEYKLLELNSKMTYLTNSENNQEYVDNIYNKLGHTSISNNFHVGFIVAGVSGETLLEFTSSTANISRLTTSRTKANSDTLYVIDDELDIPYIKEFISIRERHTNRLLKTDTVGNKKDKIERVNKFNMFNKALSFTVSMSLDNWIWYLNKKISEDYEYEFKQVCVEIYNMLKERFPNLVQ